MDTLTRNYPLNCWYVAARTAEVSRTPMQRWLLDTPVMLYRKEDGSPVALDNRCPHRWAPLSDGRLEGDNVVCPYHGARFSPSGKCASYPDAKTIPAAMQVRAFALVERGPFIWIWMGDDEVRAQTELPPSFDWFADPTWTTTTNGYEFGANYLMLHENVMDLTHFNYVHAKTFKIDNWRANTAKFTTEGDRVTYEDIYEAEGMTEQQRTVMYMTHPASLRMKVTAWFDTPALHTALATVYNQPGQGVPEQTHTRIAHILTPISPTKTHYWWLVGTNGNVPEEIKKIYGDLIYTGFSEDRVMMQAIQQLLEQDGRGRTYPEVSFPGDAGGIYVRRVLSRLMAAEGTPLESATK